MDSRLLNVCRAFCISGEMISEEEIKIGNVNRTYKVTFLNPDDIYKSYMVQKVNTFVFKKPIEVMENIDKVTQHIHIRKPGQTVLHFHHTKDKKTYLFDQDGFWRLFNYIPSSTYNTCSDLNIVHNAGEAFGEFQMLLADFDASLLHDTIPDFHNTKKRFDTLQSDWAADPCGKASAVGAELDWLFQAREAACRLTAMYENGQLPLRVTHNDTKINNVLFDREDGHAIVVIDLDTVMPGLVAHDFGDAIRFAANYVAEDSPDWEQAGINMEIFRAFADGFLLHTAPMLTDHEVDTLAWGCFVLAVELSTRFLDDYLLGNPYFKIDYPDHNLVRTRCQIALAKDMLRQMPQMETIVHECAQKYR